MNVTKKGEIVTIVGVQPDVGEKAPDFSLANLNDETIVLSDFAGQVVLLSIVPDINTRICSLQTKRFNQEASTMADIKFITISNNTKEEQANWCAAEGVEMELLHDTEGVFGKAYGLFIPEMNRLARAIFVIGKNGQVVYKEISAEISEEPDYTTALKKAKEVS